MSKVATTQQQNDFINSIAPVMQKVAVERGYHNVSGAIGQACCESNYGLSQLSQPPYYNFYGLKCGSSWKCRSVNFKTKEDYGAGLVNIRDNFRCYDSLEEGVKGYYSFIATKRYAGLFNTHSALEWLTEIKRCGYATSQVYVNTCMGFVNKHNLTRFDSVFGTQNNSTTVVTKLPTLKIGSRDSVLGNTYVRSWETFLSALGLYRGAIDGIFGKQMHLAVRNYQSMWNGAHPNQKLVVDGIIGSQTWSTLQQWK